MNVGDTAKVNTSGRTVRVLEVFPVGLTVVYRVEHQDDSSEGLYVAKRLRPCQTKS